MNLLDKEKSPYLKQHASNPVHWHAWNKETLNKAKYADKLILISIGYSTCHWCHVMEKESFEHDDVAQVMNHSFINVKVDREERPDVDDYYMDAVHLMGINGGWPLNCVALPDGRPIWAGTYLPKQKWITTLQQLSELFLNDREKAEEYATRLNNGLKQINLVQLQKSDIEFEDTDMALWIKSVKRKFDIERGGMDRAPKFPMPDVYRLLLRQYALSGDNDLINHVEHSAIKMAHSGLFDQIGGGFARYSVDADWFVPHFEKMLYDNGQLLSLYSELWQFNQSERVKEVLELTVDFIEHELTDKLGAFYCGLDADSDGVEGKFYVFTKDEIEKLFGSDAKEIIDVFQIDTDAHWEHGNNVLKIKPEFERRALSNTLSQWDKKRKMLFDYRAQRVHPGLDDKVLVAWNALTIIGLLDVNAALGHTKAQAMALEALDFVLEKMHKGQDGLYRVYHSGTVSVSAFLEDYALLCRACIRAFEITQNRLYLNKAVDLQQEVDEQFSNPKSPLYFSTALDTNEVNVRKVAYQDNVIPSANAVMAECLYLLGRLQLKTELIEKSKAMLQTVKSQLGKDIEFFSYWGKVHQLFTNKFYEIVVSGPSSKAYIAEINSWFLPGKVLVKAVENDNLLLSSNKYSSNVNRIYLCEQGVCHTPLNNPTQVSKAIWN
ncbi:MAG: thioredoxin domain-containing protein [Bacteroidia bacterium]